MDESERLRCLDSPLYKPAAQRPPLPPLPLRLLFLSRLFAFRYSTVQPTRVCLRSSSELMSYLTPSHRLFDSPDLSPFPPLHNNNNNSPSRMLNLSSYDPLPLPQHPPSLAPDQSFNKFPKVGETRCCKSLPIPSSGRSSIDHP